MKTVGELKTAVLEIPIFRDRVGHTCLLGDQLLFWQKVNRLGWERKTKRPDECNDVDATAPISDEEYSTLLQEARSIA